MPPNLAASLPTDQLQTLWREIYDKYIWPQVTARLPLEHQWDRVRKMYDVKRDDSRPRQSQKTETQTVDMGKEAAPEIAETIIFDTVDRLKNLNYFIAWKDQPVQFNRPRFITTSLEDQFYDPTKRKIRAGNALLDWNNDMFEARNKHLALAHHHYLYGISFSFCDFCMEVENDQTDPNFLLIKKIGTTFEPISLRKVWLNPQLPLSEMEKQACPFFFDLQPRNAVLSNEYHPQFNPFGFLNLDKLNASAYLFGEEARSFTQGLPEEARGIQTQMLPEYSGEALWTFYPYLTMPGDSFPCRYIVQAFANNLFSGNIVPLRIQKFYYPRKRMPLVGVSHIPDVDSGAYTPSIANLLSSHYDELVRAKTQFLLNKDWINNPPTEYVSGSPAANVANINAPGAKYEVFGANDVIRRQPYDASASTLAYIEQTRDAAQTTGKAVDAILGKAMGGRTTATEASNAFQASMSGVTADVDFFCLGHYDPYARRVWENAGRFIPKCIRDAVTGRAGEPPLDDQDLLIQIGIKTDVGSSFIESIVKQQHLQQAIASATMSPFLDQAVLWKALFSELKLPEALAAVKDNGFEMQVSMAFDQAVQTYMGQPVAISPSQQHDIALQVKTRFLQDTGSTYNKQYAGNPSAVPGLTTAQYLAQQIQLHQQFLMLQMQQQMAMQQAAIADENNQRREEMDHKERLKSSGQRASSGGEHAPQPSPSQGAPTKN